MLFVRLVLSASVFSQSTALQLPAWKPFSTCSTSERMTLRNCCVETIIHQSAGPTRRVMLGQTLASFVAANSLIFPSGAAVATSIPTWHLGEAVEMPQLALNTAGLTAAGTEEAFKIAIKLGITHVDFHPGPERDGVARVLHSNAIDRTSLFLTTKLKKTPTGMSPAAAAAAARAQINEDLRILGVDSVNLLMIRDSPDCEVMRAQWAVLEEAKRAGKASALGAVNFCEGALRCLLEGEGESSARGADQEPGERPRRQLQSAPPAVNYIMVHPGMGADAHGLRTFGESRGIRTFAYGALGEPGPSVDLIASSSTHNTGSVAPVAAAAAGLAAASRVRLAIEAAEAPLDVLARIGRAHGRLPEEVALRWVLQSGAAVSVRPTASFGPGFSACKEDLGACATGLESRSHLFAWRLTTDEFDEVEALRRPDGNPTLFSSSGCPGAWGSDK